MTLANATSGFSIREMRVEDYDDAGRVFYDAFYADSLATGIPTNFNVASVEAGRKMVASFASDPTFFKLVAVDASGNVIGTAMIQAGAYAHGVGPVVVDPNEANKGVGKSLMKAIVDHAQKSRAPSIRLSTSGSNRKSFCLYANLGFKPVECTTSFFGTVQPSAAEQAASSLSISTDEFCTRKMEESDVTLCADLYSKIMGYERGEDISAMLRKFPQECWVATTKDDTLVGYTTGLFLLGHAAAASEAAWVAVMSRAFQERDGVVGCITIPGVRYPRIIQWALAAKLVLARHNWYMVIGNYQKPKEGYIWCPSIQH